MGWLAAAVFAAIIIWLLILYPGFRYAVGGLIVLFSIYTYAEAERNEKREKMAASLIRVSDLKFKDENLTTGSLGRFSARVTNTSVHNLRSIEIRFWIEDCDTAMAACNIVGEDDETSYVSIPAGQTRLLEERPYFQNLPPLQNPKFRYSVKGIVAELPP